ncbi:DUF1031 family protein [Lactococcus kimchii]|uniref:DUF1031 family protein n=1 Tax=Lactococcus sp. S-13 TaxID=2507158 RepID=UPI0010235F94|nr:DUF1031 family protein [Lactococcus sp. S-13]RZI47999.1 DUF1031 domain-containing protein [Lactococcus sp. S-13]RZI48446.1 DUF1031 domain-containing protein [Lactococcus sp. S-13]RZI49831.1 DUF1031 domain-containing protein [Lactococcus sp. S-13]
MAAFDTLTLLALYENVKQGYLSGRRNSVWIDVPGDTKGVRNSKQQQVQIYRDICSLYNQGRPMSYPHLFKLLERKLKETIIVLD